MGELDVQTMNRQRGFIPAAVVLPLLYGVAAIALGAMAWAAWHTFTESYRDEGRAEVRAQWSALIAQCETFDGAKKTRLPALADTCASAWLAAVAARNRAEANAATWERNHGECSKALTSQSAAIEAADREVKAARELATRTLAEIAKRSKATEAKIDEYKRAAASPAVSEKEACNAATRVLSELGAMRMRYDAGRADAPAPGAGSADRNGSGSGPGSLRISR